MPAQIPSFTRISLEKREPTIYILTLQNPPENRLDSTLCSEIIQALHFVQDDFGPGAEGALVTTADSPKFFGNGVDLKESQTNPWANTDAFYPMLAAVLDFPFPTVACINGHAFGGGCVMALANDYRVMNSKRGFISMVSWLLRFLLPRGHLADVMKPPVDLGLHFKGIGALARLKLRPQIAREMMLESRRWTGQDAFKDGIVDVIAEPELMLEEALKIARKWAPKAKMGVYGVLRGELCGEAANTLRSISYIRSVDTAERLKPKI